ncbi:MAG: serine/threonine-protein kinase [Oscillospiraceae bacterium]
MIVYQGKNLCENCFSPTTSDRCESCGFSEKEYFPDPTILPVGTMLQNRYQIGGVIGKGGFGVTYIAFDTKLERRIAIKEYFPYGLALRTTESKTVMTSGDTDVFRKGAEKFYNEARFIAKFNSPVNIVNVYDVFYENETVYYLMEYLRGQTLKAYVESSGKLTSGQAVYIAKEVADALSIAHEMNVLHRDISPDNIMLCLDGKVKLIDFGAARQVVSESSQTLSVILTQGFAPFEQYQKKGKQGPWTDIYSLGASLYFGLTGEIPDDPMSRFDDDSAFQANSHSIDSELWDIIKKAVEVKASNRYQTAEELKTALSALSIRPENIVIPKSAVKIKTSVMRSYSSKEPSHQASEMTTPVSQPSPMQTMPVSETDSQMQTMPVNEAASQMQTMPVNEAASQMRTMPVSDADSQMQTMPVSDSDSQMRTMPVSDAASQMRTMPVNDSDSQMRTMPVNDAPRNQTGLYESNDKPKKKNIIPVIAGAVSGLALLAIILVFALSGKGDDSDISTEESVTATVSVSETEETTKTNVTTTSTKKVQENTTTTTTKVKETTTPPKEENIAEPPNMPENPPPETVVITTTANNPPETTTRPPETTTRPPQTTTKPPETTAKPKETTTKPPETTAKPKDPPKPTETTTTTAANTKITWKDTSSSTHKVSFKIPSGYTKDPALNTDEYFLNYSNSNKEQLSVWYIEMMGDRIIFSFRDIPGMIDYVFKNLNFREGTTGHNITSSENVKIAGRDAWRCNYEQFMNGKTYNYSLIFADSQTDLGCYVFIACHEKDNAVGKQIADEYLESLKITGKPKTALEGFKGYRGNLGVSGKKADVGFVYPDGNYFSCTMSGGNGKALTISDSRDKMNIFVNDLSMEKFAEQVNMSINDIDYVEYGGKIFAYLKTQNYGDCYKVEINGMYLTIEISTSGDNLKYMAENFILPTLYIYN